MSSLATTPTFAQTLASLYDQRFTGTIILHCVEGVPKVVEWPQPSIQVRLAPQGLDKPGDCPHHRT